MYFFFLTTIEISRFPGVWETIQDSIIYLFERGFSGRSEINQKLITYLRENPLQILTGCGASCVDTTGSNILKYAAVRDAHNVVGIVFEYGLVGILVYSGILYHYFSAVYSYFFKYMKTDYHLLIPVPFILNPSELSLLNFHSFTSIMVFTIMVTAIVINAKVVKS